MQFYHAGANEIKIGVRMVESLCGYILKPNITWFQTQTPNNGQFSSISTEYFSHVKIHKLSIGLPALSQEKFCTTVIINFMKHFAAGLSLLCLDFPINLLYRLLPQAEIILNFLFTSTFTNSYLPRCIAMA